MSKQKRNRREEERLIIEEMEKALAENKGEEYVPRQERPKEKKKSKTDYGEGAPQKIHCQRCRTLMENGVCPACGHRIYVPMDKKKREKIRLIVAGVCIAVFVVLFVIGNIIKG